MHFDPKGMLEVFPKAMLGWAGVFAVTIVIIGVTVILNKITSKKKKHDGALFAGRVLRLFQ